MLKDFDQVRHVCTNPKDMEVKEGVPKAIDSFSTGRRVGDDLGEEGVIVPGNGGARAKARINADAGRLWLRPSQYLANGGQKSAGRVFRDNARFDRVSRNGPAVSC